MMRPQRDTGGKVMAVEVLLEHLVKRFGAVRAVDGVSLRVEPGELFFLLGPSGCGKTTLLRMVAGFCLPDEGRIMLGGEDITQAPPHRRDTGMVFQSYALWPHLSVARNVAFGLEMRRLPRGEIRRRVDEALAAVRLADRAAHRPNQLSGGQQQRVALARALVVQPRCLLLDEPLSNLDAKLRLEMRGEIRRICKQAGLTSLYVTHDQKEALSIADRIAVMRDGRIEQMGAPLEVYRRPVSVFAAGFLGEANFLEGAVRRCEGGRCTVGTQAGDLICAAPPAGAVPAAGAAVTLCLRPEALRFDAPPADCPNRLQGQLRDTVYLGEVAQHAFHLDVPSGSPPGMALKAFELNPRRVARDAPADAQAWVAPADLVVLTA